MEVGSDCVQLVAVAGLEAPYSVGAGVWEAGDGQTRTVRRRGRAQGQAWPDRGNCKASS